MTGASRWLIFLALFTVLSVALSGCGGGVNGVNGSSGEVVPVPEFSVQVRGQDGQDSDMFIVTLPDGTIAGRELIENRAKQFVSDFSSISYEVADNDSKSATTKAWNVGRYRCQIRWEYGYVGGCIKRNLRHLNLHIRDTRTNRDITNVHLCVWRENGPQFGVYNSANGFCATTRGVYTQIRDTIRNALLSQGFSHWAAYSIAATSAVVLIICFGLA